MTPDGRSVPLVQDVKTGKTTIGFPDTYQDPLTAGAEAVVREAMQVATSPEAKEALVTGTLRGAEITARTYLGPVGYYTVKAIGYVVNYILTPDEAW